MKNYTLFGKCIIALLFSFVFSSFSYGQCTDINQTNIVSSWVNFTVGQSFTSTCNGQISSISFRLLDVPSPVPATMYIYDGDVCPGTIVGSQSFIPVANSVNTVVFSSPVSVNDNLVYTFHVVYGATGNRVEYGADLYAGGNAYSNCVAVPTVDIYFEINYVPPSIPTMGEWGLIILGLSLLTIGTVVIKQHQFV